MARKRAAAHGSCGVDIIAVIRTDCLLDVLAEQNVRQGVNNNTEGHHPRDDSEAQQIFWRVF
jgi:hypothetical protein